MNTEQQETTDANNDNQTPATTGDQSLTLATRKLAGSPHCLNCGTELKGPFCYFCGQPDRNFMRFFPALLRDLMEDLLDLDSRFIRTLKPLLFKPGRLTRDYMTGRRYRYVPPMRLYIFSSIVFFLLAAFLSSDAVSVRSAENGGTNIHLTADSEEELRELEETLENLPPEAQKFVNKENIITAVEGEEPSDFNITTDDFKFNDEPWDRETNPVDIKWLPDWVNDRINDEIEGSPQKARQINENPNLIVDKVFDILPATMFVLLPVVALIFKFWYLFARRFYVEHLIFSLHNHSFLFASLTLILLLNVSGTKLTNHGFEAAATGTGWIVTIISIWIPLYLLVSLRTVYQQGWGLTLGKFIVIGLSYVTLLSLVTTGVAIASFVLL